jgi:hypothetical protein
MHRLIGYKQNIFQEHYDEVEDFIEEGKLKKTVCLGGRMMGKQNKPTKKAAGSFFEGLSNSFL